jgi:hypothetical protein
MPTLETFLTSTVRMLRKSPIHRAILKTKHLVRRTQTRGAGVGAGGAAAEAEVATGAEATRRKENGIASSTRRMMIIVQITAQTRKDSRLFLRKKGRRRRGLVL